jgi:acylphosphatase
MSASTRKPTSRKASVTARVSGRVQGVGFRWSAVREAERLGISGWVRNEEDGTVTCFCEGDREDLERYLEWLNQGPPGAHVSDVEAQWSEYGGGFNGFSVEF